MRTACVWLPQLPLRVEVLRHPALDGRPLVLGGGPGERKIVHLCSPEAERAGIRPGLPLREVVTLCRSAIVVQPDPVRAADVIEEVLAALQKVSPIVELAGDRFFLDLRGLGTLYSDGPSDLRPDCGPGQAPCRLERAIRAAVPPLLHPRIGVAEGKFAASVAARVAPPSGIRVVPASETAAFLAPLPIAYLLEAGTQVSEGHSQSSAFDLQRLDLLGLRTIADLAALPLSAVLAQFGPAGARAWRLAHGQDDEPVIPSRPSPVVRVSLRFDSPLASIEAIIAALDQLLARAFASPALRGRSARQARLRALLADDTSWERLVPFKEALSSRDAIRRVLKGKLELPGGMPPAPVEELALDLMGLGGESAKQGSLFLARARQLGQIAEVARQLRARYGHVPLYRIVEVEPWSRIPERRWALVPCEP